MTAYSMPQNAKEAYSVVPLDMDNKQALRLELEAFQSLQTNVLVNYKDLANEKVNYSNFAANTLQSQQALRQCNDSYTMSMLTNCVMPFTRGITLNTLVSSLFTHKMMTMMNPAFDQDLSRMFLNWRDQLIPSKMNQPGFHPFISSLNNYLSSRSAKLMHNQIKESMDSNSLDSMVMTPRQLAALKINFMEQYYVDMRKCNMNDSNMYTEFDRCTDQYNKALEHINAIALHSGFDMSVVAEEERYLVGIKMKNNPSYANMFEETHSMFGAIPCIDDDGTFSGGFESRDGHMYTVGGHVKTGAFTPRKPFGMGLSENERKDKLADDWNFFAKDCASMLYYLDYDCPCSRKAKLQAKSQLNKFMNDFKERSMNQLVADFGMNRIQASLFYKANFTDSLKDYVNSGKNDHSNPMNIPDNGFKTFGSDVFKDEINFAIDKEMMAPLKDKGISPVFRVVHTESKDDVVDTSEIERNYQSRLSRLYEKLEDVARSRRDGNGKDMLKGRSGKVILEDMRNNYIDNMTGDELFRLMTRAGNNCAQSYFSVNKLGGVRVYTNEKNEEQNEHQRNGQPLDKLKEAMNAFGYMSGSDYDREYS